jgi:hypothetical protein
MAESSGVAHFEVSSFSFKLQMLTWHGQSHRSAHWPVTPHKLQSHITTSWSQSQVYAKRAQALG